jgi:hypothetical protein
MSVGTEIASIKDKVLDIADNLSKTGGSYSSIFGSTYTKEALPTSSQATITSIPAVDIIMPELSNPAHYLYWRCG